MVESQPLHKIDSYVTIRYTVNEPIKLFTNNVPNWSVDVEVPAIDVTTASHQVFAEAVCPLKWVKKSGKYPVFNSISFFM